MIIQVKVIPQAKKEKIQKIDNMLKIWLKTPAKKGKANIALIKKLAGYFGVSQNQVKIVSGFSRRQKIVKILGL